MIKAEPFMLEPIKRQWRHYCAHCSENQILRPICTDDSLAVYAPPHDKKYVTFAILDFDFSSLIKNPILNIMDRCAPMFLLTIATL